MAAGFSRRFGSNKLLHPLHDGRPMALAAALNLRETIPSVLTVINNDLHNSELPQLLQANGIATTICPDAEEGIGTSLAWAVQMSSQAAAWIIALADMPFIQPTTIKQVTDSIRQPHDISAPFFEGRRGHPVGFGRAYYAELAQMNGDKGANSIVLEHSKQVKKLTCDDESVLIDIDTVDEMQKNHLRRAKH